MPRDAASRAERRTMALPALRFFTIAQVLAKLDAGKTPAAAPIRQAALAPEPGQPISDGVAPSPGPKVDEPFGLAGFAAPDITLAVKWKAAKTALATDHDTIARCQATAEACTPAARRFVDLVAEARDLDGLAQLERVSQGVNHAVRYQSDMAHYGVVDRWASPLETLGGSGDCEDFAIAKYAILQKTGVPSTDLRIVLLRDAAIGEDHAVTAVRTADGWRILDNRRDGVLRDGDLPNYMAVAALDDAGVKLLVAPYAAAFPSDVPGLTPTGADDVVPGGAATPPGPQGSRRPEGNADSVAPQL
jgi:predicted transglutaminase-like cysteine proteinase